MKKNQFPVVLALASVGLIPFFAQSRLHAQGNTDSALSYLTQTDSETEVEKPKPKTTADKIQDLQKGYDDAFTEFSTLLNRLSTESNLLGSKELFSSVDKTDREMKKVRTLNNSILGALRTQTKNIQASKTFTEEQKQELTQSAEEHINSSTELSTKLDAAIKQLATAYAVFPRWKTIHNSYLSLQGEEKAADQVKAQVDEFLNGFTAEAQAPEENTAPASEAQPAADGTEQEQEVE